MNVSLTGMSRTPTDGRFCILPWREHLEQSIADILTTPIGSRAMRPEYGSRVSRLVDRPINQAWKLEVSVAVVEALSRWEPRIRVKQVRIPSAGAGYIEIAVDYELAKGGRSATAAVRVAS